MIQKSLTATNSLIALTLILEFTGHLSFPAAVLIATAFGLHLMKDLKESVISQLKEQKEMAEKLLSQGINQLDQKLDVAIQVTENNSKILVAALTPPQSKPTDDAVVKRAAENRRAVSAI